MSRRFDIARELYIGGYFALLKTAESQQWDEYCRNHSLWQEILKSIEDYNAVSCCVCGGAIEREVELRQITRTRQKNDQALYELAKEWYANLLAADSTREKKEEAVA